jgi:signal peptidase II
MGKRPGRLSVPADTKQTLAHTVEGAAMDDGDRIGAGGGRALRLGLWLALAILLVDQAHKWWMIAIYGIEARGRVVVTPFLDLVYVINKGISYGLFTQGDQSGQYMLTGFAGLVTLGLGLWLWRGTHTGLAALSIGLIMGGAVSNAIDRLHLGGVADFFDIHFMGFHWYVFNIADAAIVAGVVGLMYDSFASSRTRAPNRP